MDGVNVSCMNTRQSAAVQALLKEREFQDKKWGLPYHHLGSWLLLIESELAEAKLAIIKGGKGRDSVRSEIIQVGALCIAALEQHGTIDLYGGRQI